MLTTSRFYLRKLLLEDANSEYLSWLKSETSKEFITFSSFDLSINDIRNYIVEKNKSPNVLFLGIFDKSNHRHIGNIKFEPIDVINKYTIMGVLIGDNNYKGIGAVTEILDETGTYLKNSHGIEYILLGVSNLNNAAIRAYSKSGFIEIEDSPFIVKSSANSVVMIKYL